MDTGYVLAWVVGLSSLFALSVGFARRGVRPRGWMVIHAVVVATLVVGAAATNISTGGKIAAVVWVPFVLVPILAARGLPRWLAERQFTRARAAAQLMKWLHPADGWQHHATAVEVLHALERGRLSDARQKLETLADSVLRRSLEASWYRASGRFEEAGRWLDQTRAKNPDARLEPAVLALEIRVAGELGDFAALISAASRAAALVASDRASLALMIAAFTGERALTDSILNQAFPTLPRDASAFWRWTAAQRAGSDPGAAPHEVLASENALTRAAGQRRQNTPLRPLSGREREHTRAILERLRDDLETNQFRAPTPLRPRVTASLVALLLFVFVLEIPGGVENPTNLHRMGALTLPLREAWRLFSAGLLHFGWLHLTLNVLALGYFGSRVERRSGPRVLAAVFVSSNVGAMALVALTATAPAAGAPEPWGFVVGASGGVLGVVGALAAWLLVTYIRERPPELHLEIGALTVILLFQIVFDAVTPIVSGAVHLYGLAIGFVVSLVFGRHGSKKHYGL